MLVGDLEVIVGLQAVGQSYRTLQCKRSTGSDGKMCGVRRVTHEYDLVAIPRSVGDAGEVEPRDLAEVTHRVHEGLTVEGVCEDLLQPLDALVGSQHVEAESLPGLR